MLYTCAYWNKTNVYLKKKLQTNPELLQCIVSQDQDILLQSLQYSHQNHKINIEFHHLTRKLYLWFADSPNSMLQDPIKDCILRIAVSVISQFGKLPVFPFLSWPWHFIKNTGYFVGYLSIWVCLVFFPVHQELQVVNMSQYWSFPQLS